MRSKKNGAARWSARFEPDQQHPVAREDRVTARRLRAPQPGQISGSARIFIGSLYLAAPSPHSDRFAGFGGQTELIHL